MTNLIGKVYDPQENYFGIWPFLPLPKNHPFQRAAFLHDVAFDAAHAGEQGKTRAEVDADLFYRMTLLARAEIDPERQCDLLKTICRYWPVARDFGRFWWNAKE